MMAQGLAVLRVAILAPAIVALAGCSHATRPRTVMEPSPEPSSPQAAVRLFAWCWNHRSIDRYAGVLTEDYRFVFAPGDPTGDRYRNRAQTRDEELSSAAHLFVGGATLSPAKRIRLDLDPDLVPIPDHRAGKDPGWHQEVRTSIALTIVTDDGDYDVVGTARFFVVRGDSAILPPGPGFVRDSSRWYIDQWNEETVGAAAPIQRTARPRARPTPLRASLPTTALPAAQFTIGRIKALYQ